MLPSASFLCVQPLFLVSEYLSCCFSDLRFFKSLLSPGFHLYLFLILKLHLSKPELWGNWKLSVYLWTPPSLTCLFKTDFFPCFQLWLSQLLELFRAELYLAEFISPEPDTIPSAYQVLSPCSHCELNEPELTWATQRSLPSAPCCTKGQDLSFCLTAACHSLSISISIILTQALPIHTWGIMQCPASLPFSISLHHFISHLFLSSSHLI